MNKIITSISLIGGIYNLKNGHTKGLIMIKENYRFDYKDKKILIGEYFGASYLYTGNMVGSFIFGIFYGLSYLPSLLVDKVNNNNKKMELINRLNIYL